MLHAAQAQQQALLLCTKYIESQCHYNIWIDFVLGCVVRKCVLPEGLAKELPKVLNMQKCLDSIDCTMVLTIPTYKFDSQNTPDAFKHVPDLF